MRNFALLALLLFFGIFPETLGAGTFYLYIEETCNGEPGLFLYQAREGLLDVFFDKGHIVFDDLSDKGKGTRILSRNVAAPLATAREGGAEYLIALAIDSNVEKNSAELKAPEFIKSRCRFLVYQVGTGRIIAQGDLALDNEGKVDEFDRKKLGFTLGREAGAAIVKSF